MAKSSNQKLKLICLAKILNEQTDEAHPMTVQDMIGELEKYDICAERKSIYDDIEALRTFGMDIVQVKSRSTGYYIGQRPFELAELKLLVDSVQSSKFITEKKTLSLIRKIEGLTSRHEAQLLQRQVYVRNRVKSMNESVYYNVDTLSNAISSDRQIHFRYFEYAATKQRRFRRNGEFYRVSPFALMCDNENYYMLAYDPDALQLRHYRVDKMTDISVLDERRLGKEAFAREDMATHGKRIFGMFSGSECMVQLRFAEHLCGAVIDRFGKEAFIISAGDGTFTVSAQVAVSPQFFAWVFGFGKDAEIVSPPEVRQQMRDFARGVADIYG